MLNTDIDASTIESVRKMVEDAGGYFVGIQQDLYDGESIVCFTFGSSSALRGIPLSQMSVENVKSKIGVIE